MNNTIAYLIPYKYLQRKDRNTLQSMADSIVSNGGDSETLKRLTGYNFTAGTYKAIPPKE